jgi:hypothetical protein
MRLTRSCMSHASALVSQPFRNADAEKRPRGRLEVLPGRSPGILHQTFQFPQRDGQHRKIEIACRLKVGEHLSGVAQGTLIMPFPLPYNCVPLLHLRAQFQHKGGKFPLQIGDVVYESRFGKGLPMRVRG